LVYWSLSWHIWLYKFPFYFPHVCSLPLSSCFTFLGNIRRKVYDEYNDEEVELTKEETKLIRRLLKGKTPHAEVDPYAVCTLSHATLSLQFSHMFPWLMYYPMVYLIYTYCIFLLFSLTSIGLSGRTKDTHFQMPQSQRGGLCHPSGSRKRYIYLSVALSTIYSECNIIYKISNICWWWFWTKVMRCKDCLGVYLPLLLYFLLLRM